MSSGAAGVPGFVVAGRAERQPHGAPVGQRAGFVGVATTPTGSEKPTVGAGVGVIAGHVMCIGPPGG
jgi:hypothetical protein